MTHRCLLLTSSILLLSAHHAAAQGKAQDKIRVAELSSEAEAAIEKGLAHIAKSQNADGSWSNKTEVSITSLSLMAFMVKGYFPQREPHGEVMAKGVNFLLETSRNNNGYLGTNMYDHGLGTLALSEVWGESKRSGEIREALKNAVRIIVHSRIQGRLSGGWGYSPDGHPYPGHADVSITAMQIVALASAREAGILVPDDVVDDAVQFVKNCQKPDGSFGYTYANDPSLGAANGVYFARSAAGTTALLIAGDRKTDDGKRGVQTAVKRGVNFLHNPLGHNIFDINYPWYFYGHFYAVQAMYQSSEKDYLAWYPKVRDTLIATQNKLDGSWKGGIPPNTKTKVQINPNHYCTPMAVLTLGVPYRFLPIYQR